MLYECELTFLEKKPFVFVNKDDVEAVGKQPREEFLVGFTEEKLIVHRNSHYQLCVLETENFAFRKLDDR